MKILIDTHALLWLITDDKKLSKKSKLHFIDPKNELYFSMASFWEICIKVSIGKLSLSENWEQVIIEELVFNSVQLLPVSANHCIQITRLPFYHRDPFDRLIIARAIIEEFHVMSIDENFSYYPISLVW